MSDPALPSAAAPATVAPPTAAAPTDGQLTRALVRVAILLDRRLPGLAPSQGWGLLASGLLLLLAAVLGNQDGVLGAYWPFCWPSAPGRWCAAWPPRPHWTALAALALVPVQAVLFVWARLHADRQAAADRQALQEYRAEVAGYSARVEGVLRDAEAGTVKLPSRALGLFREAMDGAITALLAVSDPERPPARADVDVAIRAVLDLVRGLVEDYDRTVRGHGTARVTYSANVMLRRAWPKGARERKRLADALVLVPPGQTADDLEQVLELRVPWSVSGGAVGPDGEDAVLRPVVLPLAPRRSPAALPGSAFAACSGEQDRCPSVEHLRERVLAAYPGHPAYANEVAAFFARPDARHIQSFVALPITDPEDPDGYPLGTVNVNCSQPGLFEDIRQLAGLAPFLQTLLLVLPELIRAAEAALLAPSPASRTAPVVATTGSKGGRRGRPGGGRRGV